MKRHIVLRRENGHDTPPSSTREGLLEQKVCLKQTKTNKEPNSEAFSKFHSVINCATIKPVARVVPLSVSPGCARPCLFCNRLLSGSRCPDSVSPLRPPWNRRTDKQTYRPNTVMQGQAARNTKGLFSVEVRVGGRQASCASHW